MVELLIEPVGNKNLMSNWRSTVGIAKAAFTGIRIRTSHLEAETCSATKSKSLVLSEYLIYCVLGLPMDRNLLMD